MISDEELLLYHYGDGLDDAERGRIAQALNADPDLAIRQRGLVAQLDAAAATPNVRVPAEVHQRWQASLERVQRVVAAPATEKKSSGPWFGDLGWRSGAAVFGVLLLAGSLGLGLYGNRGGSLNLPVQIAAGTDDALRYERGLQWHLASTERQLAGLDAASGEERTRLIDKVIAQNHLYALAADRANEARLARVLRSFTPILESLTDDHAGKSDFEGGLAQLNFELKVMQARLATATSTTPPAQPLAL